MADAATASASAAPTVQLDEFAQQAVTNTTALINQRNEKVGLIKAAEGDPQALLEALRKSSENAEVVKINAQIDKLTDSLYALETRRDELLKPEVEAVRKDASSKVEAVTAEVDTLDTQIRAAKNFLKQIYGEAALSGLPEMTGRKNRESDGSGSRIRGFDVYVDDTLATQRDGKGVERSNFSAAAKAAGVDTVTLQEGFWAAQGTKDSKQFKDRVEFTVTEPAKGEEAAKTHKVVAVRTPKSDDEAASE